MCDYVNIKQGKCKISNENCPFVYYCTKIMSYKPSSSMPNSCPVKEQFEVPKGFYKVEFERHGNLYIEVDGIVEIVKNPNNYVPTYVKMTKLKSGVWRIKKSI